MGQNVPRPGQVLSGTMQRPGINFSRTKYVVAFAVLLFKKLESKNIPASLINIQHTLNRPYKSRTSYSVEQLLRYGLLFKKLESKNIPASLINIQHTLNRPYKSRTSYSVEQLLRYGLPKVSYVCKSLQSCNFVQEVKI